MKRILILGAGTAGTMMANKLRAMYGSKSERRKFQITVVDQSATHVYQPGLIFVPFGMAKPEDLVKPSDPQLSKGVEYIQSPIHRVVADENRVELENGKALDYDLLIIATGSRIVPEETEGLKADGWRDNIFDFYTVDGAQALSKKLADWQGGKLVLNVVEMPIKCPVAPLEFVFLADWFFTKKGIRERVDLTFATPLDGAFTKPLASSRFSHLLDEKKIKLVTEYNTGEVDASAGKLLSWDDREIDFDLLVTVPVHMGAEFVERTPGLGDDMNWILTDPNTLQSKLKENIFAIGDATNVPSSKAGSVAHFEGEVVANNVHRFFARMPLESTFDGHANCFIETGFKKAVLIDFNYDVEPLPGRFPLPNLGPLALMRESRINHWGKVAFEWVYWNMLLKGKDIPLISTRMTMNGKTVPDGSVVKPTAGERSVA